MAASCRVACFTQHHVDQLDLGLNAVDYLLARARAADPTFTPEEVRRRIGRFGLTGYLQVQRMGQGPGPRAAACVPPPHSHASRTLAHSVQRHPPDGLSMIRRAVARGC